MTKLIIPQFTVKVIDGKRTYELKTIANTEKKKTNSPTTRKTNVKPGKLERKVIKTTPIKAKRSQRKYDKDYGKSPKLDVAEPDESYIDPSEDAEYSKADDTDYMNVGEYQATLKLYSLVSNDEKNTILRRYRGNLISATKEIEELDEQRRENHLNVQTPTNKQDIIVEESSGNGSGNGNGNGQGDLETKTLVPYDPNAVQPLSSEGTKVESRKGKGYNPMFGIGRQKTNQRGIPKINNNIPEPELPPVEGVIPPYDPRYGERLRLLSRNCNSSSVKGRSTITTKKTDGGREEKVVPGLKKVYQGKSTFSPQDLRKATPPKLEKMIHQITHYEKFFTMNHTQGEVVEGIGSNWTRSAEIDSEK